MHTIYVDNVSVQVKYFFYGIEKTFLFRRAGKEKGLIFSERCYCVIMSLKFEFVV